MTEKYELKLCSNGEYYLWENNVLLIPYIDFDTFNKESANQIVEVLNTQEEIIQKQNQEITACYDTLTTIEELCDAVLNYDFKDVNDKVDFCHMLNEMDNKDLMFLKECFEAIRSNDLKRMTSLTLECNEGDVDD